MRKQSGRRMGWEFVLIDDGGRLLGKFHFHAEGEERPCRTYGDTTIIQFVNIGSTTLFTHATLNKKSDVLH